MKVKRKHNPTELEMEIFRQDEISHDIEYKVYGIVLFGGKLSYLIQSGHNKFPKWMPSELFFICDSNIEDFWKTGSWLENGIELIISYDELCSDYEHYVGIIERDAKALLLFDSVQKLRNSI